MIHNAPYVPAVERSDAPTPSVPVVNAGEARGMGATGTRGVPGAMGGRWPPCCCTYAWAG